MKKKKKAGRLKGEVRPQGEFRPLPRKMQKKPAVADHPQKDVQKKSLSSSVVAQQGQGAGSQPQSSSADEWKTKYEEVNRKYQFLMAEYANYKKQNFKQMENLRKYEGQGLIRDLLDKVVDNFELALKQNLTEQNSADFKKGVQMIYTQLKAFLQEAGVKEAVQIGEPFNPAFHNALDSQPAENIPPDHILHIIKKAYLFHDKLIRPAEVIVSRKSTKEKAQDRDSKDLSCAKKESPK